MLLNTYTRLESNLSDCMMMIRVPFKNRLGVNKIILSSFMDLVTVSRDIDKMSVGSNTSL